MDNSTSLLRVVAYCLMALLPGVLWLRHFYLRDVFEPEPKALVARMFGLGIVGFILAVFVQRLVFLLDSQYGTSFLRGTGLANAAVKAFFVIALTEEALKLLIVYVFVYGNEEFDEPMDGVVYGVSCALGFSTAENVNYMLTYASTILVVRMVFSCFLHAGCSGLSGYYLGRAKFQRNSAKSLVVVGFGMAWLLHGLYDFFVFSRWFHALFFIIILLWFAKEHLDSRIDDALERSPFKPAESGNSTIEHERIDTR